ncbi:helix-turn-helix domain-containing protein [Acetobacter estunensis]
MTDTTLGNRLRTLRKERRITQSEVASAVGVSRSHLATIERGLDNPGRETLMALADFYGVSMDWLAATPGRAVSSVDIRAQTHEEALLLSAFRKLPKDEAEPLLRMLISRSKSADKSS